MYREPHLNEKNKECSDIWYEWYDLKFIKKEDKQSSFLRKEWCKCCDELSAMISQEVKTNPRYSKKRLDMRYSEPPI
tara:strand:+ start:494 stop:724 length:231 start_codon:yes stop_codon:yes gene_type:complete